MNFSRFMRQGFCSSFEQNWGKCLGYHKDGKYEQYAGETRAEPQDVSPPGINHTQVASDDGTNDGTHEGTKTEKAKSQASFTCWEDVGNQSAGVGKGRGTKDACEMA